MIKIKLRAGSFWQRTRALRRLSGAVRHSQFRMLHRGQPAADHCVVFARIKKTIFTKTVAALFRIGSSLRKLHVHATLSPNTSVRLGLRTGAREGKITAEEDAMNGQAETHRTSLASRRLALPACPKCNDTQFAPAASEFVSKGQVRHFWSCEACGHEFSTSVRLAFLQAA